MDQERNASHCNGPSRKGHLYGQKMPLNLREIWAIRNNLQVQKRHRDLALLNLGIDSKLRGCDLVSLQVNDVSQGNRVSSRTQLSSSVKRSGPFSLN
jgi:hypothetical protein